MGKDSKPQDPLSLLAHVPAVVALVSVLAIIVSFVFEASYLAGRDAWFAMQYIGVADLLDHAGLAIIASVLGLASVFVGRQQGLRESRQELSTVKNDDDLRQLHAKNRRELKAVLVLLLALALVEIVIYSWRGWTRQAEVEVIFQLFLAGILFSGFKGVPESLGLPTVSIHISTALLFISFSGAMLGASDYQCPQPMHLKLVSGQQVEGSLVAKTSRGVVFGNPGGDADNFIPWPQVARLNTSTCKRP